MRNRVMVWKRGPYKDEPLGAFSYCGAAEIMGVPLVYLQSWLEATGQCATATYVAQPEG